MFNTLFDKLRSVGRAFKQRKLNQERVIPNQGPNCRKAKQIDLLLEKNFGIGTRGKKKRFQEMSDQINKFVKKHGYTAPKPYQFEGIFQIKEFKIRAILGDDPGLGKTLQALYTVKLNPWLETVVVVCPSTVKYQWKEEAKIHCGISSTVLEGTSVPKRGIVSHPRMIIINYDILGDWKDALLALKPDLVVLDEIQTIRNINTAKYKNCRDLLLDAKGRPITQCVLGLTGTLVHNRASDVFPPVHLVRPDLYPNYTAFCDEFSNPGLDYSGNPEYKGGKNLEKLNKDLVDNLYVRRKRNVVFPDALPTVHKFRMVEIRDREQYEHARDNFLEWLEEESPDRVAKAKKAEGLVKIGYLLRLIAKLKRRHCKNFLLDFLENHPDRKLIVFGVQKDIVRYFYKKFQSRSLLIDGSVKGQARFQATEQFRKNRRFRFMFANIKAGGAGWNGEIANHTVFFQFPWTDADLKQARMRMERMTQNRRCFSHYIVAKRTVEERVLQVLQEKKAIADAIQDGKQVVDSIDMYSTLVEYLKQESKAYARKQRRLKRRREK